MDRTRQEGCFSDFYADMRKVRSGTVQVYVLIEDDLDRPEFLVDRLYELQVRPLAEKTQGDRRGSCLRQTGTECVYGSLSAVKRSVARNFFAAFGAEFAEGSVAGSLVNDDGLSLHSHIVFDQTVDGHQLAQDADKFIDWFTNEFWRGAESNKAQWLVFLVLRFSTLDPANAGLRETIQQKLETAFGSEGRANVTPDSKGAPCLLFPAPDPVSPEHLRKVLTLFPIDSVEELNEHAKNIFAELTLHLGDEIDPTLLRHENLLRLASLRGFAKGIFPLPCNRPYLSGWTERNAGG